jgi:hypothetical protein
MRKQAKHCQIAAFLLNPQRGALLPMLMVFSAKSVRDPRMVALPSVIKRDLMTSGIMYFYDYGNPFILPYFEYDKDFEDYRKISIIP